MEETQQVEEREALTEMHGSRTLAQRMPETPEPLSAIRPATAFARLPLHQLSKKGNINIRIIERDSAGGQISLKWVVSANTEYGMPGQLAYKIDTIVIQSRLNDLGRPLPRIIRIGTLTEIARELNHVDGDTATIKHALLQNASSFVTAKLKYKTQTGEGTIGGKDEIGFTRYAVRFRGEEIEGNKIECVYLILNDPYYEVLNNSTVQPLDQNYRKALAVGSQRFYEILSFEMFTALRYPNVRAKVRYSNYCTIAPQTRFYNKRHMQSQMAKIHRQHVAYGYIKKAHYQDITDASGMRDWIISYDPGPRAIEEFEFFNGRRATLPTPPPPRLISEAVAPVDEALLRELTKRGIGERKSRELLADPGDQDVMGQLEYTDELIAQAPPGKFHNPAGLYISRLNERAPVPATFETSAKKKDRLERERLAAERIGLETAYGQWREVAERSAWNALTEWERQQLIAMERTEVVSAVGEKGTAILSEANLQLMAERRVRSRLARHLPTLEEWHTSQAAA